MNERQIDRLLIKIAAGDNDAFESFSESTKRGVFSFIYAYLKNYAQTEDAMQTVYIKVKLNIDKYRPGTNGRAWLLQIAKNQALNDLDKLKRERSLQNDEGKTDASLGEVSDAMRRVLTDEEQQIVVLHVIWGYKHREIAREMGVPVGSVTSKYKRSIAKLKEELSKEV